MSVLLSLAVTVAVVAAPGKQLNQEPTKNELNSTSGGAPIQDLLLGGVRIGEQLPQIGDRLLQELNLVHVLVAHAAKLVRGGDDISMVGTVGIRAVTAPSSACNIVHRPGRQDSF